MAKIDFDQLDDFDLTGIVQDDIIKYNASTENLEPAKLPVYGTQYNYAEKETATATSSTTFQLHQSFTTPSVPAGTYLIMWNFTYGIEDVANPKMEVRVRANGTDLMTNNFDVLNNNANDNKIKSMSMRQFVRGTPGTINVTLELRRQDSNKVVTMYDSRITLIRVL